MAPVKELGKKVLNSAHIESWDRRGFVQFFNAICLDGARYLKAKFLKGTERHQVQIEFVGISVVLPLGCVQGTQCKTEEKLRPYNPHTVWVQILEMAGATSKSAPLSPT